MTEATVCMSGDLDSIRDSICDDFEQRWKSGQRPEIADFLCRVCDSERSELLRELLEIELWWRREETTLPTVAEYHSRFRDDHAVVDAAFTEFHDRSLVVEENRQLSESVQTVLVPSSPVDPALQSTLAPDTDQRIPARGSRVKYFGEYELLEEIARGGMGVVFKARQIKLNRIVALKMILSGELAGDEEIQRFKTEAEAAAKLDHPGIVPIYEIGEHDGQHYFSMGFVDGQSLADRVKDGPLPPREAAELVKKAAEAVAYAHEKGVIHRDLKPANVLLDANSDPRVTDFGLAKQVESDRDLTRTGAVIGTPSYMPPEQARGKSYDIGPKSDVYSLGAILYCLLTGRPPFQSSNVFETLKQVVDKEPISPKMLNPEVDENLETICLRCLEKDPNNRFTDARFLVDELTRFLAGLPILSRQPRFSERIHKWCLRNRAEAVLIVTVVLVVVLSTSMFAIAGLPKLQVVFGASTVNKVLVYLCIVGPLMSVARLLGAGQVRTFEVVMLRVWENCMCSVYAAVFGFAIFVGLMFLYETFSAMVKATEDLTLKLAVFIAQLLIATFIQKKYRLAPGIRVTWGLFCFAMISAALSPLNKVFMFVTEATTVAVQALVLIVDAYGFTRLVYYAAHKYAVATEKAFGWVPWPFSLAAGRFRVSRILVLTNLFPLALLIGLSQVLLSFALVIVVLPIFAVEQVRLVLLPESPTASEAFGYFISAGAFVIIVLSFVV